MSDLDLARRAMKAAGWALPRPVEVVSERGVMTCRARDGVLWVDVAPPGPDVEWLPDLDDRATMGALEGQALAPWGPDAHLRLYPQGNPRSEQMWGVWISGESMAMVERRWQICGRTRAEAAVSALEARRG